mmetsp:Transcript_31810/g.75957  ORF Transcript_31810/g.75957 Transcript_31810/m.75957 type:complete len:239 (-) Transcript_31810:7-723(-)
MSKQTSQMAALSYSSEVCLVIVLGTPCRRKFRSCGGKGSELVWWLVLSRNDNKKYFRWAACSGLGRSLYFRSDRAYDTQFIEAAALEYHLRDMAACPNPFMLRSNDSYGMSLQEACRRATSTDVKSSSDKDTSQDTCRQDTCPYSRESDRIGEGVPYSDSTLSRVLRQRESDSMNKRRKNSMFARQQPSNAETPGSTEATQVRYGISQSFSKSFNNMMYIDEGLVTSKTKSNIDGFIW